MAEQRLECVGQKDCQSHELLIQGKHNYSDQLDCQQFKLLYYLWTRVKLLLLPPSI